MFFKLLKILKLFLLIFLIIIIAIFIFFFKTLKPDLLKFKYLIMRAGKPLNEIQKLYADKSCTDFSDAEKQNGFEAFVTSYCKPEPPQETALRNKKEYYADHEFLCRVGLNCGCPNDYGREDKPDCFNSNGFIWSACKPFPVDEPYCHLNFAGNQPRVGEVAADLSCFPINTVVNIKNLTNPDAGDNKFIVADKGSAIKGRRFDVWTKNCDDNITGIYKINF
jgi:hypothetical protein